MQEASAPPSAPKEATAAEGIGEGPCREADSSGEPLVVDWKPEQRGDLELMMKENVAIVSYSCKGFKLLKDCKVDGTYGFLGMSRKEQVVKLNNADEVKANLPLGGIGIAGSISAEMARGSTLDVAMIMVGKVKTTWAKVQADELKGECEGATHFVKGAMVGAFVMQTGTKGQVKSAAQMFGATASGASTSEKNVQNKDGDIGDCAKATPDDKKAPGQCQAFIRLELKGIIPKAAPAAGAAAAAPPPAEKPAGNDVALAEATCPKGLVMSEGKCTEPKSAAAYLCNPAERERVRGPVRQGQCAELRRGRHALRLRRRRRLARREQGARAPHEGLRRLRHEELHQPRRAHDAGTWRREGRRGRGEELREGLRRRRRARVQHARHAVQDRRRRHEGRREGRRAPAEGLRGRQRRRLRYLRQDAPRRHGDREGPGEGEDVPAPRV